MIRRSHLTISISHAERAAITNAIEQANPLERAYLEPLLRRLEAAAVDPRKGVLISLLPCDAKALSEGGLTRQERYRVQCAAIEGLDIYNREPRCG